VIQRLAVLGLTGAVIFGVSACGFGGSDGINDADRPAHIAAGARGAAQLQRCLTRHGLDVRPDGTVPGKPRIARGFLQPDGTRRAGSAFWPSGNVVDLWLTKSKDDAESAESDLASTLKKFNKAGDTDLVFHRGFVVYAYDDFATPTPQESKTLDRCL
jgi:hypothetical protein